MKLISSNKPLLMDFSHPQFVNNLLNELFDQGKVIEPAKTLFRPAAEILQTENAFYLTLALSGMKKEDIKIELTDEGIVVSGERKREMQTEQVKQFHTEMMYGVFKRVFDLKADFNQEEISAEFTDGLLKIELPLKEKVAAKFVEIK